MTMAGISRVKSPVKRRIFICFIPNCTSLELGWEAFTSPCNRAALSTLYYSKFTSPYIPDW